MKKKLLSSLLSLVLCFTLVVGSTYALFTSESKVNIAVSSGTVNVVASVKDVELYSMGVKQTDKFENGGTATVNGGNLALNGVTAGDKAIVTIAMENKSDVTINYHIETEIVGDLAPMLDVKKIVDENGADKYVALESKTSWAELSAGQSIDDLRISIELPVENEDANGIETTTNISIKVIAQQGNAPIPWNGTADTSWYDPANPQTEYTISTAEQIAGLSELVDGGETMEGIVFKLTSDVDLYAEDENGERISFDPIGYGYDVVFKGTFDGQGHTISNLYQNGWALGLSYGTQGGGLFASVQNANIKNVTIDKAEIVMECVDMGALVGYSYGNCIYENITISNTTVANYNRYTGGVVGEVNGTQTFKNVDVKDSVVSALWGTYNAALGGIVGGKWGEAELKFEDCDVNVQLDAFNDACSNYQYYNYRLCGMLIGMTEEVTDGVATASYLTCINCTVTYDDWANYTYCEFESNGRGSYAAPDEWKFSRVQGGYATDGVEPNHTHDTDESHEELLVFDQLFGGDKGVRGGKTHPGVNIVYNNK